MLQLLWQDVRSYASGRQVWVCFAWLGLHGLDLVRAFFCSYSTIEFAGKVRRHDGQRSLTHVSRLRSSSVRDMISISSC